MKLSNQEVKILQQNIDKMMYNGHDWDGDMWDLWESICVASDEIVEKEKDIG